MDQERRKFARDTILSFLPPLAQNLGGFGILVVITKLLGAEGYGIWSQVNTTISFLTIFVALNLGNAMNRFLVGAKEHTYLAKSYWTVLWVVAILATLIGIVMISFKAPIALFLFGKAELAVLSVFLALLLLLRTLNVEQGNFLKARRFIPFFVGSTAWYYLFLAAVVMALAFFAGSIEAVIMGAVGVALALGILQTVFLLKKGFAPSMPRFSLVAPLLSYGLPLLFANMGYWIVQVSDRYIVQFFVGIEQVGLYATAYSIAFVIGMFWTAVTNIVLADFSALYDQGAKREIEMRFARVLKYGSAITCAAITGFVLLAEPILRFLSSEEFVPASSSLVVVAGALGCYGVFRHYANLLSVLKKVKTLNMLWVGMGILNVVLNLFLIPLFGILGAAISTLAAFAFGLCLVIFITRRYFAIRFPCAWVWKIGGGCVAMALFVILIPVSSLLWLGVAIGGGMAIFLAALVILRFPDAQELSLFSRR